MTVFVEQTAGGGSALEVCTSDKEIDQVFKYQHALEEEVVTGIEQYCQGDSSKRSGDAMEVKVTVLAVH